MANPVVKTGEKGAFRWVFRRYTLEVETLSGNWKARWTADDSPYVHLVACENDDDIRKYFEIIYEVSKLLMTEQRFANDCVKAVLNYSKRLDKAAAKEVVEDEIEEKAALEFERQVQEHIELPKKERRKVVRDINGRFAKAVKEIQKDEA